MTFKKAKTIRNGLSMSEMNPLNHKWSDFAILSELALHQFQKNLLLRVIFYQWPKLGLDSNLKSHLTNIHLSYFNLLFLKKKDLCFFTSIKIQQAFLLIFKSKSMLAILPYCFIQRLKLEHFKLNLNCHFKSILSFWIGINPILFPLSTAQKTIIQS